MKKRTLKKALSLFLAVLMIALALPLTMLPIAAEESETIATTITHAKIFAKRSDGYDLHTSYGSVAGMIDGDPYDTSADGRSKRPYYESESISSPYTPLMVGSTMSLYYGYAVFELNGLSTLDDVTIWLTGNGYAADKAVAWSDPTSSWGINDGYEILVSTDGETWTFLKEFSGMCGDGTDPGAKFPVEGDAAYASKTVDGYLRVGHKIDLRDGEGNGVSAKYVAVAVTAPSKDGCIDIGEVTVNGTVDTLNVEKTPAEIYAAAGNGDLLKVVDFNDMSWRNDFADHNNWHAYVMTSANGRSLKQLIHSKAILADYNNKRSIWGGFSAADSFSTEGGEKYTITYDARFGNTKTGVGIMVDCTDNDTDILVTGSGDTYLYKWNTKATTGTVNWLTAGGFAADKYGDLHSFAVEVDTANGTMTLYVKNTEGEYVKVETFTGVKFNKKLDCRIYTRYTSGTVDGNYWNEIADVLIYKGAVSDIKAEAIDRAAEYDSAKVGDLLNTVNFNSLGWAGNFASDSNRGAYITASKDGSSATLSVANYSSKRAMWAGYRGEYTYPLTADANGNYRKYTVMFDVDFGNETGGRTLVGIQVDGNYAITVDGNGNSRLWDWNNDMSADTEVGANYPVEQWDYDGLWSPKSGTQTFAVEVDPEAKTMSLYIVDLDGSFNEVATYGDVDFGDYLSCRIVIRGAVNANSWAKLSNLLIYKGLPVSTEEDRVAEYDNAKDGDLLYTVNFADRFNWRQGFYSDSNYGADAVISEDGSMARLTLIDGKSYNRAIWGGIDTSYPLRDVVEVIEPEEGSDEETTYVYGDKQYKYTIIFDLEFGNTAYNKYGLGVMADGDHSIVIDGFGCNRCYKWNTEKVGKSDAGEDKWNYSTDVEKSEKHTFAVEVDPENNTMTLYVADANGAFNAVRTLTYDGAKLGNNLNPRIYTRKLSGTSDANSWTEISDMKIYKGLMAGEIQSETGAAVRLSSPTGIRFESEFRKYTLDSLKKEYGEENVKLGMIITPTDYLTENGVDFTMEALDACDAITGVKYVKIDATTVHVDDDGLFYTINCALVNVKAANYTREFSARAFIEINGEIYKYSDFDVEYNSRSVAEVARKAYGDTKTEMGGDYVNAITIAGVTVYSPYDADEMKTLTSFFNQPDGEGTNKNSTISVLTYNLEYKRDDAWEGRNPANAVQIILDVNPDVVGLQEDTEDWNDYLAVLENKGYANIAGDREYKWSNKFGNGWAFNDIYYKTEKFTLVTSGWDSFKNLAKTYTIEGYEGTDMSIDSQGDAEGWFSSEDIGRTFSYAVLKDNTTGEVILFVNTHLHYGDGTSSSDEKCADDHVLREYQSRLLAAWMKDQEAQYPTQILTGDMNAHINSNNGKAVLNGYSESGLSFARDEACITGDTGGTLASSSNYVGRDEYVFDHILFRNTEALTYTVVNVMNDPGTVTETDEETGEEVVKDVMRYPSDHIPVYATFAY